VAGRVGLSLGRLRRSAAALRLGFAALGIQALLPFFIAFAAQPAAERALAAGKAHHAATHAHYAAYAAHAQHHYHAGHHAIELAAAPWPSPGPPHGDHAGHPACPLCYSLSLGHAFTPPLLVSRAIPPSGTSRRWTIATADAAAPAALPTAYFARAPPFFG
jgi:hypothetical protein